MNMNEIPKATHSGTWVIDEENDIKIECYVMDNKERVLSLRGAARGIGIKGNGSQKRKFKRELPKECILL